MSKEAHVLDKRRKSSEWPIAFTRCGVLIGFLLVSAILSRSTAAQENASTTPPGEIHRIQLNDQERAWIKANPKIRVHNETDWPPFNFAKEDRPLGYSIEYMNLLGEMTGLQIEYVTGPAWGEFLEMMKRGELDVMLNIVKTPERQKYLLYTPPYADNPNTILSSRNKPYNNLEQLFGKTISVPKGFFYEEILKKNYPKIKLHLVKGTLESMKAVVFGQADAALGELAVFNYLMANHMMSDLTVSGEVKMGDPEYSLLNIATRKDLPILVSILSKAIRAVGPEQVRTIQQKWIGEFRPDEPATPKVRLTKPEQTWLDAHPNIRLGVDPTYPPFEFVDDQGKYQGIASDYIRLINERLGIEMKPATGLSWKQVVAGAKARTIDVLPAASKTPEREQFPGFTKEYSQFPVMILTRDSYPFVAGLGNLTGKKLALVKEFAVTEKVISQGHKIEPLLFLTPLEALRAVSAGNADATVMNLAVATDLLKHHKITNIKVAAPAGFELPGLSFAVRNDWPELITILDKVLASITPEEESAILTKWIAVRYEHAADQSALIQVGLQVAGGALVIVFIIFLWNRRLRREVEERRKVQDAQRTLLEAISLPIIVVRQDNAEIQYINEAAAAGRPAELLLGSAAVDLYVDRSDRQKFLRLMEEHGRVDALEVALHGPSGDPIWALLSSRGIVFEGHFAHLSTWTDITDRRNAEEALRRSEQDLRAILESSPLGVNMTTRQTTMTYGTRLYSNRRFAELMGVQSSDDLIGLTSEGLWVDPEDIERHLQQRMTRDDYMTAEVRRRRVDGSVWWCLYHSYPIVFEGTEGWINWHEDITERKRSEIALQESEARLKAFLDHATSPLYLKDVDGRYIVVNKVFASNRGMTPEEMMGKNVRDIFPTEMADEIERQDRDIIARGSAIESEFEVLGADGVKRDYFIVKFPVYSDEGALIATGAISTDIGDRKRAEAELHLAKEEAEEAARMRSRFLANMSHELRTPLTSIRGSLSLIEIGTVGEIPEEAATLIQIANESAETLVALVNDILDLEKIRAGQLVYEFAPLDLKSVVRQAMEANQAYGYQFGVAFELLDRGEDEIQVNADRSRLIQVLNNFLSNAAKYSPQGGRVVVTAEADGKTARVSVADDGPGIPEEFRDKMFSEFYQVYTKGTDRPGGTGLGLSIAKSIIDSHQGVIGYDTKVGAGATFYFELPLIGSAVEDVDGPTVEAKEA